MGRAEGVRRGDGHVVVWRGAALGEESPALAQGVSPVGAQDIRPGGSDLVRDRPGDCRARTQAGTGDTVWRGIRRGPSPGRPCNPARPGRGGALLEAMSYRLPVIASNVGGITDIVADGKTGLLVPPADPAALAGALERLATDTALAEQLAEAGRQYVEEHFSWPAILEEWQSCYAAAVAAGGKGRVGSGARAAVSG